MPVTSQGVQRRTVLVVIFFVFLKLIFCFVVAIFDLVHDVQAMHDPMLSANSIWKYFLKYECCQANCSFRSISHISEKISRCC